jgi:WS/DGAT/MGAT family acyltransferase
MASAIRKLSVLDAAFLFAETAECPMHVGSLTILKLPAGYAGDFFEDVKARFAGRVHLAPSLRHKLAPAPFEIDRPSWVEDESFDIDRHVIRAVVPKPGDRATLQRLVGWMHAMPLNRARPLWEVYVFDRLPDGEAAIYSKIHHAFIDGGAGAALTEIMYERSATAAQDPPAPPPAPAVDRHELRDLGPDVIAAYADLLGLRGGTRAHPAVNLPRIGRSDLGSVLVDAMIDQVEWQLRVAGSAADIARALAATLANALEPGVGNMLRQLSAPATPFNVTVSSERSFATVTLPLARVKALAGAAGGKVNDAVLALSAGMLRHYLLERDALPNASLTAAVPISARDPGNADLNTQAFGMIVPLATGIADPAARLAAIIAESQRAKGFAEPLRPLVPLLADIPTFGTPMALELLATFYSRSALADVVPPPFNVVVSNVFFSKKPFFIAGAELIHVYPMSIVVHGQGLNITVQGYRDGLDFGLVAAANVVPHLGRMAARLTVELDELERAVGVPA